MSTEDITTPEVGTCSVCGQELIRDGSDVWHPHTVKKACPPESAVPPFGVLWGESSGRPGADKFIPAARPSGVTREQVAAEVIRRFADARATYDTPAIDDELRPLRLLLLILGGDREAARAWLPSRMWDEFGVGLEVEEDSHEG